jgi:hypothetical protein
METSARTMSNVREVFELVSPGAAGGRAGGRARACSCRWALHSPMQLAAAAALGSRVVCGFGVAAYSAHCPRLAWRANAVACACALRCSLLVIVAAVCAAQAVVEAMASRQRKQRAVAKDKPCCAVV